MGDKWKEAVRIELALIYNRPIVKTIESRDLWTHYSVNEKWAEKEFKDKKIAVKGVVTSIGKNDWGKDWIVELSRNPRGKEIEVRCTFKEKHILELIALKIKQKATISGICLGVNGYGSVMLQYCRVASEKPNSSITRKKYPK